MDSRFTLLKVNGQASTTFLSYFLIPYFSLTLLLGFFTAVFISQLYRSTHILATDRTHTHKNIPEKLGNLKSLLYITQGPTSPVPSNPKSLFLYILICKAFCTSEMGFILWQHVKIYARCSRFWDMSDFHRTQFRSIQFTANFLLSIALRYSISLNSLLSPRPSFF